MKKWLGLLFALGVLVGMCSAQDTDYPRPVSLVGFAPDNQLHQFTLDSNGNLNVGAAVGALGALYQGYVRPVAPMAIGPDGQFHYFNLDSNGNVQTTSIPYCGPATAATSSGPAFCYFNDLINSVAQNCGALGAASGNNASVGDNNQGFNVPGFYTLISGTGGAGTGEFCTWAPGRPVIGLNTGQWAMEIRADVPVLPGTTAATYELGMPSTVTTLPWPGANVTAAFCLSTANGCGTGVAVNDWACVGGTTTTDSGVAATTGWTRFKVSADGTNMHYFINGVQVCSIAQSTAYSGNVYLMLPSVQAGTITSVNLLLDYISMYANVSR